MTPTLKEGNFGVNSVKLLYFFKNLLLYSQVLIRQTKYVVMMTKEGSTKIEKIHNLTGRGSCARAWPYMSYNESALFLEQSSSLHPGIDQTKQVCSNDDQGRVYQNYKFHDPWGRGSCARAWSYKSFS